MKKLKKVLLSLCLILCLGFVGVGATACTTADLSEEQNKKLLKIAENGDEFMKKTLEILQNESKNSARAEACAALKEAALKICIGEDDCWDNMAFTCTSSQYDETQKVVSYKYQDTNYLIIEEHGMLMIYEDRYDDDNITTFADGTQQPEASVEEVPVYFYGGSYVYTRQRYSQSYQKDSRSYTYMLALYLKNYALLGNLLNITEDNILDCTKSENGDICITVKDNIKVDDMYTKGNFEIYEKVVVSNGKIASMSISGLQEVVDSSPNSNGVHKVITQRYSGEIVFSFGTTEFSDVKPYFDELKHYIEIYA